MVPIEGNNHIAYDGHIQVGSILKRTSNNQDNNTRNIFMDNSGDEKDELGHVRNNKTHKNIGK